MSEIRKTLEIKRGKGGCIGCDACSNAAPETFHVPRKKKGAEIIGNGKYNSPEQIMEAMKICPMNAIKWRRK